MEKTHDSCFSPWQLAPLAPPPVPPLAQNLLCPTTLGTLSRPLISGRFDPNDYASRFLPPNHNQPSELEADEMNSTVVDGLRVRHYHTHHNNQTYNIYVSGDLPTSVPGKEEDESFSTHNAEAPTNIETSFPKTKPPKTYAFPAKIPW
ncbi:hypothetical protein IV203_034995 [Nitzschia inconspicua]|uniref:Uncharacterized protein n=1 Tax=Nitzschia inconspicua TaxID=303405 RepID=A0A9K3LD03_9STRA|nr:hypothetical protein IV203_034995 [Nitzschia inconspicua]